MQPNQTHSSRTMPGLTRCLVAGLAAAVCVPAMGWMDYGRIMSHAAKLQPVDGFEEIVDAEETLDDVLGEDSKPGFSVMRGDNSDLIDDALNAFHTHLDAEEWEKAFRSLIDLSESTRHMMAPLGDSPVYVPIRRSIQERLRTLPPQGRRAFQLFYDAQAREMLERCREHKSPGSEDQLRLTRELYELFFMTSVGDAAADLLGDLYFERGEFALAQHCWESVLEHHPGSSLAEIDLQFKRVLAMHRGGEAAQARALAEQVALRFDGREVAYGGAPRDAAQALEALLGNDQQPNNVQAAATDERVPSALPERGTDPLWQMTFIDDATKDRLDTVTSSNNYYGPTDLRELTPPTAADENTVYAHWHGVVFAMELDTGKLLWRTGRFVEAAQAIPQRMGTSAGNPRGYKIALAGDLVLVQSAGHGGNARQIDRFSLAAYNKTTGELVWDSSGLPDWRGQSFCGQPLVINGQVYAITHQVGTAVDEQAQLRGRPPVATGNNRELVLHRLDPTSGASQWSLPLGEADMRAVANAQYVWMPQPMMQMHGRNLYVLTNNGAVLAVDIGANEVAWAVRLRAPEGGNNQYYYNQPPPSANAQGPGGIEVVDGVLYVKEARSPRMYAINPESAELLWERDVPAESELIAADREHLYVMAQAVRAYPLDSEERLAWNNSQLAGPTIGSGVLTDDTLYVLGGNKLRALSLENGDPTQQFSSRYLRGRGGQLFMAGDKIVCVTRREITVYEVPTEPAPQLEADLEPQGNQP